MPEEFDSTGGFAVRTETGGVTPDGAVRNTWELTPLGVASFASDEAGGPMLELSSLTGTSRWRAEVCDPLTPDPDPRLRPSLVSVLRGTTTWLVLIERGSEAGRSEAVVRFTTYDAETGHVGGRSSVAGVEHGVGHDGANVVVFLDNGPDQGVGAVVIDPATGEQERHDPIGGRDDSYAWNDTVVDVYQGKELVLRQCTDIFIAGACPSGLLFDGQWVSCQLAR